MATIKEELLVLGIRQVAITCRRGTSVARSPKLLALFYPFLESIKLNIQHHTSYKLQLRNITLVRPTLISS